ncbi:alpha/beta fold hydrolase [Streptomyces scopuliridis]|uniref:alpha/beta fold hydrolase n=1 Tax=Streptomyces scopuliridis TaxID=452529 RepID=UPI003680E18A
MGQLTRTVRGGDGVRLTCFDHGGDEGAGAGRPVLLLHGLAGHAAEWDPLVRLLRPAHRVVAYDARGHGASERRPADVSRAAHVRDVVTVAEHLALDRPGGTPGRSAPGPRCPLGPAGGAARGDRGVFATHPRRDAHAVKT